MIWHALTPLQEEIDFSILYWYVWFNNAQEMGKKFY